MALMKSDPVEGRSTDSSACKKNSLKNEEYRGNLEHFTFRKI